MAGPHQPERGLPSVRAKPIVVALDAAVKSSACVFQPIDWRVRPAVSKLNVRAVGPAVTISVFTRGGPSGLPESANVRR